MVINKSKKKLKYRGSKTHGCGSMKKRRGAGHRGGRGAAGSGKRGDAKKPSIWGGTYFGKHGFHSRFKKPNTIISVTADGPKGPKKVAKPGSVITASKHNAQVLAVSALSNKYWEIPSWDKTKIPKPFSTIYVRFSSPFNNNNINSKTVSSFINSNQNDLNQYIDKNA